MVCKVLTYFFILALSTSLCYSKNLANYAFSEVPGCPDFKSLNKSIESISQSLLLNLTCICGQSAFSTSANVSSGVSINCIYGSTLEDLKNAIELTNAANRSVHEISLNNLRIEDNQTSLSKVLQSIDSTVLYKLEIKKCRKSITSLNLSSVFNLSLSLPYLQSLVIDECELSSMPLALLQGAPRLELISFANNKIKFIEKIALKMATETLQHLDLSGNLISDIEPSTFSQLKYLKSMQLGEHNYASPQLKQEIKFMSSLQFLDLTRMDGIDSNNKFDNKSLPLSWSTNSSLKKLKLTGCNLHVLNPIIFQGLTNLTELDIKANLLERIEPETFTSTPMLRKLSISANFLKSFPKDIWNGLTQLQYLDLADNEFTQLNATMFEGVEHSLEYIDLRYNERLKKLEKRVFAKLDSLQYLNLSHSALQSLEDDTISSKMLKRLDLSYNNISLIEEKAFEMLKQSLESLNLSNNQLKSMDLNLLVRMDMLTQLDLSGNPWICDLSFYKVINWINKRHEWAESHATQFTIVNPTTTVCHRPYAKRGVSIFKLEEQDFSYQIDKDTTIPFSLSTSATDLEMEGNSTPIWRQQTIIVGGQEDIFFNDSLTEDPDVGKPSYDINSVKYGQKYFPSKSSNTWVSGVIVILLVIITAISVIFVVIKKKAHPALADTLTSKSHPSITTIF